jgi:hypothetical protein
MTETTTAATKAKSAKHAASSFALPDYGLSAILRCALPLPLLALRDI